MRVRRTAIVGAAIAATLAAAPAALAAPSTGGTYTLGCTNGATYTVTTIAGSNADQSRDDFTPGFIVGTHQVIVPYQFTFTATNTATGETQSFTSAKHAPIPAGAVDCTFDAGSGNGFVFTGHVIGVIR